MGEPKWVRPSLEAASAASENKPIQQPKTSSEVEADLLFGPLISRTSILRNMNRKKRRRNILTSCVVAADIVAIVLAFCLSCMLWIGGIDTDQLLSIFVTIIPIHIAIALNNKAFQIKVLTDVWKSVGRGTISFLLAAGSLLLILFLFKASQEYSRIVFSLGIIGSTAGILIFRTAIYRFGRNYLGRSPYANLCIYDDIEERQFEQSISARDFGLIADPKNADAVNRLGQFVSGMDRVIVHCTPEKRDNWVSMLRAIDIKSEIVIPELNVIKPLKVKKRNGKTSLLISVGQMSWDQKLVKRSCDLVCIIASFPVTLPLILIFATAVKMESSGPAFFRQERIGLGNRKFRIWKLRSMRFDSQDDKASKLTERDDPRITRVGNFIRKTSIDELPQIFNVLTGDMSVVGPRPHAEQALAGKSLYWEVDNSYWHRHVVKPGITGLAQIRGHRGNTFHEKHLENRLQSDLEYVADWSIWDDLRIILKTFQVLLHNNAF